MDKYYLSICAIVKNEACYLDEWISFHLLQGVSHFYLYDNESSDLTWSILSKYKALGIATIEQVPTPKDGNSQRPTYNKFLKEHGEETTWCSFLDCDEFLFSPKGRLDGLLRGYEEYPAVAANWILYGSSGRLKKSPGLVIERFTYRCDKVDRHVKTILQPEKTIKTGNNAHYFIVKGRAVDENKKELPEAYHWNEGSAEIFRINHYHIKSKEEYFKRKSNIDVDGAIRGAVEDRFKCHDINDKEEKFNKEIVQKVKDIMEKNALEYFEGVWEGLKEKPWQVKSEFFSFLKFILENKLTSVLEVGTYKGGTASALLKIGCFVTSIDVVKQDEIKELEKLPHFQFFFREHFIGDSPLRDDTYDLLFIDGDHSYDGCLKDYTEYKHLVRPGGYIFFHDVVKSDLHIKQECGVWKVLEDLNLPDRIDFITDGNWGGLSGYKV